MVLKSFFDVLAGHEVLFVIVFLLAMFFAGGLVFVLAVLRAGVPFKSALKSRQVRYEIYASQGLVLYDESDPPEIRKPVGIAGYAKAALMLLAPGVFWALQLRALPFENTPFLIFPIMIWSLTAISTTVPIAFFIQPREWFDGAHLLLLAIPAALLGGLIACI